MTLPRKNLSPLNTCRITLLFLAVYVAVTCVALMLIPVKTMSIADSGSLNSVIRKSVKTRKVFPSDDAAFKVIYQAIQSASKKWTMPIKNWKEALNRFMVEFEKQLTPHI
jgi:hypothetical protein